MTFMQGKLSHVVECGTRGQKCLLFIMSKVTRVDCLQMERKGQELISAHSVGDGLNDTTMGQN